MTVIPPQRRKERKVLKTIDFSLRPLRLCGELLYLMDIIKISFLILFSIFLFAGSTAADDDPFKGPWDQNAKTRAAPIHKSSVNPLKSFVTFYRDYISPIDGDRCPMYPTCSQYSIKCFEKHGLIMGWIMTCDRLFHEADEMKQVPMVMVNGRYRFYDPVGNNDFWWYDSKE
ncbi:MAG: membrane protein insertion efficiency factor YidD [Pseudomonadota bacterium]